MDYSLIYSKMKPNIAYKAKDLGVAPASMTAMVRRGLVEKINTTPYTYKKIEGNKYIIIASKLAHYQPEYFTLFKKDKELGMLCSMKGNQIVDCYGNAFDLTDVVKLQMHMPYVGLVEDYVF